MIIYIKKKAAIRLKKNRIKEYILKTFAAILKGVGGLTFIVGILTVINTFFNLNLTFYDMDLPNDIGAAVMFFIFAVIVGAVGFLLDRRR
jgi:hypothetical protein